MLESLTAYDTETLTVSNTAVGLTVSKFLNKSRPCKGAVGVVSNAGPVRWLATGDTPTATDGQFAVALEQIVLRNLNEVQNFKAIRQGSGDGQIDFQFFR